MITRPHQKFLDEACHQILLLPETYHIKPYFIKITENVQDPYCFANFKSFTYTQYQSQCPLHEENGILVIGKQCV